MIDITRCPLTSILTKTHIILSNMKSKDDKKGLFYMKYPNSGLGAFLDRSVHNILAITTRQMLFGLLYMNTFLYPAFKKLSAANWQIASCNNLNKT